MRLLYRTRDSRCAMWLEHYFTVLFAHVVNGTDVPYLSANLIQCSKACLRTTGCFSFFYNRKKRACTVSTKRYLSNDLAVGTEYAYYVMRPGYDCPLGFDKQGSSCYFLSTYNATYWNATKICSELGSHLAVITSEEEDDVLRYYARTKGKAEHYLIGATDVRQEGTWLWENPLRPMEYTNWEYPQPDNSLGDEDCLELRKSYSSYQWNDESCNSSFNFICEIGL